MSSAAIDGSWLLSFQGATRADFDQLSKYFESGDYERVSTIEMEGMVSHAYNGSEWTVNIGMLGDEDDEPTLNYVVGTVTD